MGISSSCCPTRLILLHLACNEGFYFVSGEFITGFDSGSGDKKSPIVLGRKEPGGNITLSTAQQPVLVANSKGVVKVDARSMPNLASGVYIMSKSSTGGQGSGLIKVDSSATASPSTPNIKVVTGTLNAR